MHTEFYVVSKDKVYHSLNTVSQDFPEQFGGGCFMKSIAVNYERGGESNTEIVPAKTYTAQYLGDGCACFCFSVKFHGESGTDVTSISFLSEEDVAVNEAYFSDASVVGEVEIIARAYLQINGREIILSDDPLPLFEILAGLKRYEIVAKISDDLIADYSESGFPVEVSRSGDKLDIIVEHGEIVGRYIAFFADKRHIFSIEHDGLDIEDAEVDTFCRAVDGGNFAVGISEIAGSALTASSANKRLVPYAFGKGKELPVPFAVTGCKSSPDGDRIALRHTHGIAILKREQSGFVLVNPFSAELCDDNIKDYTFCEDVLAVLSDKLSLIIADTGETLASYAVSSYALGVCVPEPGKIVLYDETGVRIHGINQYGLIQNSYIIISGGVYGYDQATSTLTCVSEGKIHQIRFTGGSFVRKTLSVPVSVSTVSGVFGRWGRATILMGRTFYVYDIYTGESVSRSFSGADEITADESGTIVAVKAGRQTHVYRLDDNYVYADTPEGDGPFTPIACGLVSSSGKLLPISDAEVRFELLMEYPDEAYCVTTETPCFTQNSTILTFEARV